MTEQWFSRHFNKRLRPLKGERMHPGAFAGGEYDCLHE
jgi:hypothetical protein